MPPTASVSSSSGASGHLDTTAHHGDHLEPDLETVVAHLVAAKRSLSSINHVWRANEIVTTARSALEETSVLSARAEFLYRELEFQLRALYQIKDGTEQVAHSGSEEFSSTLRELDDVDEKLQHVLDTLRETPVEAAFMPTGSEPKTLHDYVDENSVKDLQTVLKDAIDKTTTAQADLDASNAAFDEQLDSFQRKLSNYHFATKAVSSPLSTSPAHKPNQCASTSIPELLHSLELHAQEMADLLESLVHHFDLCATAVKHTEGGGAAALRIAGDLPSELAVGVHFGNNEEETDKPNAPPEPLTESDYEEMLEVIVKDAAEAEDVVAEISDRINEMETTLDRILSVRDLVKEGCVAMIENVRRLDQFYKTKLHGYVAQSQVFSQIWKEQHEYMQAGMGDLSDLRLTYIGFLEAYDDLILEIARRKSSRLAVERVLQEARAKLDKLYEDDLRAREAFRVDQGPYIPSDIWSGLERVPMRVEFKRIFDSKSNLGLGEPKGSSTGDVEIGNGGKTAVEDHGDSSITQLKSSQPSSEPDPGNDSFLDLPKTVVELAFNRKKARVKANRLPRANK